MAKEKKPRARKAAPKPRKKNNNVVGETNAVPGARAISAAPAARTHSGRGAGAKSTGRGSKAHTELGVEPPLHPVESDPNGDPRDELVVLDDEGPIVEVSSSDAEAAPDAPKRAGGAARDPKRLVRRSKLNGRVVKSVGPTAKRPPAGRRPQPIRPPERPVSPTATVETKDNTVVVRFPPAAPPPFPLAEPPAAAPAALVPKAEWRPPQEPPHAAEPAARVTPEPQPQESRQHGHRGGRQGDSRHQQRNDQRSGQRPGDGRGGRQEQRGGGRQDQRGGGRRHEQRPAERRADERPAARQDSPHAPPPAVERPAPVEGASETDLYGLTAAEIAKLSPSQKRRLRRKRRIQLLRQKGRSGPPPIEQAQGPEAQLPLIDAEVDEGPDEGPEDRAEALTAELDGPGAELLDRAEDEVVLVEPDDDLEDRDDVREEIREEAEEATTEAAPAEGGDERPRRGRRRSRRRGGGRNDRFRERTDAYERTDSGEVAGVIEPSEARDITIVEDEEGAEAAAPPVGNREMLINFVRGEECRIAILNDNKLEEIYLERTSAENHVGNIYKGIITNVEPSIQAAFIDFGLGKNGFLHISDLHPKYFPNGSNNTETVGRKMPRRHRPPIQRCLRRGQEMIVQITKEGIGTKGPTLSTYISIPGRFLVMMPGMGRMGVSRKIEDDDMRHKLRDTLAELELPSDMGFIARTAAVERTRRELQSDLNYLTRLWRAVERRINEERAPAELYRESDLVIRTIRDVFATDIGRIFVDDAQVAEQAQQFLSIFSPKSRDMVVYYDSPEPIFHKYGIEAELERLHSRHVPLPAGGSLVIDQTEALVAIDVNSGRYRTEDDAETTAYKINLQAADEVPRQLRLRDLGGVIICDFIDMREERHRREVERRLIRNLKQHKERAKVLRMSQFGIVEMTRQRQRASLTRSVYQDCTHCRGSGLVKTAESVALDVMREIQLAATREHIQSIEVLVSAPVAHLLQNRKRSSIYELEQKHRRQIWIRQDPNYGLDQSLLQCYDSRGRPVPHP